MTTSCSQLVPGKTTTPIRGAIQIEGLELEPALLDHRVGQQAVGQLGRRGARRPLVRRVDLEAEGTAGPHVDDAVEAQRGQRPLDGGTLGVGDAGPQLHLDPRREPHAVAPYQSSSERPVTRS